MKRTTFCLTLWLIILVAFLIRLWQVGYAIDEFGFYAQSKELLCFCFDGVLWIGTFAFAFCSRFLLKGGSTRPIKKNLWLGLGSLALAFFCLPQAYVDFVNHMDWNALERNVSGIKPYTLSLLHTAPSVITALAFVLIAVHQIRGRKVSYGLALTPVLSELLRVIVAYTQFGGLSRVTEHAVSILFMTSFLLFCLSQFWLYFKGNQPKGFYGCYAFGSVTALFGLMSTLPHWIFGNNQMPLAYVGFGAAIYALVWMGVHSYATPAPVPKAVVEETPQPDADEASEQ